MSENPRLATSAEPNSSASVTVVKTKGLELAENDSKFSAHITADTTLTVNSVKLIAAKSVSVNAHAVGKVRIRDHHEIRGAICAIKRIVGQAVNHFD